MTGRDGEPATWQAVGPLLCADLLDEARLDLEEELIAVAEGLREDGEITERDVRQIRQAIDGLQGVVERRMAPLVGLTPYGPCRSNVTYGGMCEALGISIEDVNELRSERGGAEGEGR